MSEQKVTYSDEIHPGDILALGDVHATWKPYGEFLSWVKGSGASIVVLGDLIDRGGEDLKVLGATRNIMEDPESWGLFSFHVLMGNHEKMFLDSFSDWGEGLELFYQSASIWFSNGGSESASEQMAKEHYGWIKELPFMVTVGDTMFVHGGIPPGRDPRERLDPQGASSVLWMRRPFLTQGPMFQDWTSNFKTVVHGHTPTPFELGHWSFEPLHRGDRVNIDTGSCFTTEEGEQGRLTAYNVTQNTFKQFSR
jgi:serine/threonine protein phosphatase 1